MDTSVLLFLGFLQTLAVVACAVGLVLIFRLLHGVLPLPREETVQRAIRRVDAASAKLEEHAPGMLEKLAELDEMREAIQATTALFCRTDRVSFTFVNRALTEFLGEDVTGMTVKHYLKRFAHPEDVPGISSYFAASLADGVPTTRYTLRLRRAADDHWVPVTWHSWSDPERGSSSGIGVYRGVEHAG